MPNTQYQTMRMKRWTLQLLLTNYTEQSKGGNPKKAPGPDGISNDFFKDAWNVIHPDLWGIIQEMHAEGELTPTQNHGMMVFIPKKTFRPTRRLQDINTTKRRYKTDGPYNNTTSRTLATLYTASQPILWDTRTYNL
jgi:hypothetical protein